MGVRASFRKKSKAPRTSGAFDFSCHLTTSGSSHRKRPVHVVVGGGRTISRDGRVIDDDRSACDQVKPAAYACTRGSGSAELAREARAGCARRAAAGTRLSDAQAASAASRPRVCGITGDDVGGLELFGPLLRTQPGIDGQNAGSQIVDCSASGVAAISARSAVTAECIAAVAAVWRAIGTVAADAFGPNSANASESAVGLV